MKISLCALIALAILLGLYDLAISEEAKPIGLLSSVASDDSVYSYDENNLPEIFFFPKEKARWDGTMVTMSEWYTLTELQKEKFINEYIQQLQDQYKTSIDVMGVDYLKALNIFSSYSNNKTLREPSTKFINILLNGQGKLSIKDQSKYEGQK